MTTPNRRRRKAHARHANVRAYLERLVEAGRLTREHVNAYYQRTS